MDEPAAPTSFLIHEMFPTLQGEGSLTGSPAVFIRFSGCNLWSGREENRKIGRGECSEWCDTEFVGGSRLTWPGIVNAAVIIAEGWKAPLAVLTGGEPLLQLRAHPVEAREFILCLQSRGFKVAIETNGTLEIEPWLAPLLDHVTLSPKGLRDRGAAFDHIKVRRCTDLKIVIPTPFQVGALLQKIDHDHLFFQPKDEGGDRGSLALGQAMEAARAYGGRVSVQVHKHLGIR